MRQAFAFIIVISVLLTACGAQPAASMDTPLPSDVNTATNPPSTQVNTATSTPAITSTTVPTSTATPTATFTPTVPPPPLVIGLDNFSQLVQLHDYSPDLDKIAGGNDPFFPVYSPDSKSIAVAAAIAIDKRTLFILDVGTGDLVSTIPLDEGVKKIFSWSFSPDGQKLLYSTYPDGKINIWDIAGQKLDRVFWSKKHYIITDVATSPDGKQITAIVGSSTSNIGRILMVWDAASGDLVKQIPADTQYGVDISKFSTDGNRLVLSTQKGGNELTVFDTSTWKKIANIHPQGSDAELASISPNGAFVLTSKQSGGDILLWDAATGQQISSLHNQFVETTSIEFSPDGSMLIVSGTAPFKPHTDNDNLTASIWDTSTWTQVGNQHWVHTDNLHFAPDGKSIMIREESALFLIGLPDDGILASQQMLMNFSSSASKGDYANAGLFFLSPSLQDYLNSKGLTTDPAAIMDAFCRQYAYQCLPLTIIYSERNGNILDPSGYYSYWHLVQFTKPEGSLYADDKGATIFWMTFKRDVDGNLYLSLPDDLEAALEK